MKILCVDFDFVCGSQCEPGFLLCFLDAFKSLKKMNIVLGFI